MRAALLVCVIASSLTLSSGAQEQPRPAGADWPTYNRDLAGTRFSPLDQINTQKRRRPRRSLVVQIPSGGWLYRRAESGGDLSASHADCRRRRHVSGGRESCRGAASRDRRGDLAARVVRRACVVSRRGLLARKRCQRRERSPHLLYEHGEAGRAGCRDGRTRRRVWESGGSSVAGAIQRRTRRLR